MRADSPLRQTVLLIAQNKMLHATLPVGTTNDEQIFVLTADTMTQDAHGIIHGKPIDRTDAINKIKAARDGNYLATAFCIEKRIWRDTIWISANRIEKCSCRTLCF